MVVSAPIFGMERSVVKDKKNVTVEKVFGDKAPIDLTLEECKKAIADQDKAKTRKRKKKIATKKCKIQ